MLIECCIFFFIENNYLDNEDIFGQRYFWTLLLTKDVLGVRALGQWGQYCFLETFLGSKDICFPKVRIYDQKSGNFYRIRSFFKTVRTFVQVRPLSERNTSIFIMVCCNLKLNLKLISLHFSFYENKKGRSSLTHGLCFSSFLWNQWTFACFLSLSTRKKRLNIKSMGVDSALYSYN